MNTNVNHEISLLLKEKGYDKICQAYFKNESLFNSRVIEQDSDNWNGNSYSDCVVSSPTISEVIMWLYEKHGIWISVDKVINVKWANNYFDYKIANTDKNKFITQSNIGGVQPNTPTEDYQDAILHTLKNLI